MFMPLTIENRSIEAVKWLALITMAIDHINKYLFNGSLPYMFEIGRLALPLFLFAFAYNLSRPSVNYQRVFKRLTLFAVLSSIPYMMLGGLKWFWWPLNVFTTFIAVLAVINLLKNKTINSYLAALLFFLVVGYFVEYWWVAVSIGVFAWLFFSEKSPLFLALLIVSVFSLSYINGNYWALAALPIFYLCTLNKIEIPRLKYFFYAFYPLHLLVLLLIRIPMEKAGFLFIGSPFNWL
jgi:hypothetical protein